MKYIRSLLQNVLAYKRLIRLNSVIGRHHSLRPVKRTRVRNRREVTSQHIPVYVTRNYNTVSGRNGTDEKKEAATATEGLTKITNAVSSAVENVRDGLHHRMMTVAGWWWRKGGSGSDQPGGHVLANSVMSPTKLSRGEGGPLSSILPVRADQHRVLRNQVRVEAEKRKRREEVKRSIRREQEDPREDSSDEEDTVGDMEKGEGKDWDDAKDGKGDREVLRRLRQFEKSTIPALKKQKEEGPNITQQITDSLKEITKRTGELLATSTKPKNLVNLEKTWPQPQRENYDLADFVISASSHMSETHGGTPELLQEGYEFLQIQEDHSEKEEVAVPRQKTMPVSRFPRQLSAGESEARVRSLVHLLYRANSLESQHTRLTDFCNHLLEYPEAITAAVEAGAIPVLLYIQAKRRGSSIEGRILQALASVGYTAPVKGHGIRALAIDGGGSKGVVAIEMLKELEKRAGRPIQQLFDIVYGTSTGAVVAFLLFVQNASFKKSNELYHSISMEVFDNGASLWSPHKLMQIVTGSGTVYNTEKWVEILKEQHMSDLLLIETSQLADAPKVGAVSTLVTKSEWEPFAFRTYTLPPHSKPIYKGNYSAPIWEALKASSAAPWVFEESTFDGETFLDGGISINCNNPSALLLHDARRLWPTTPFQCVLSLGNGLYRADKPYAEGSRELIKNFTLNATCSEPIHRIISDTMPELPIYRLTPTLTEEFWLNECRPEKMELMEKSAREYIQQNDRLFDEITARLLEPKSMKQSYMDWWNLQREILKLRFSSAMHFAPSDVGELNTKPSLKNFVQFSK